MRINETIQPATLSGQRPEGGRSIPKGFTLLEMLVASVITTLIMVIAVSTLRTVTHSRNKLDDISNTKSELRFAANMIRRDLANIYRETSPDPKMPRFRLITGQLIESENTTDAPPPCALTFYTTTRTPVRRGQPESDIVQVEYFLQQAQDEQVIQEVLQKNVSGDMEEQMQGRNRLLRRTLPNPLQQKTAQGTITALADNIVGFQVRYMAPNKSQWQETWNSKTQLPDLIEVALAARVPKTGKIIQNAFLVSFPRFGKIEGNTNKKGNGKTEKSSGENTPAGRS